MIKYKSLVEKAKSRLMKVLSDKEKRLVNKLDKQGWDVDSIMAGSDGWHTMIIAKKGKNKLNFVGSNPTSSLEVALKSVTK